MVSAAQGQVQRHRQGQPARQDLFRLGLGQAAPCVHCTIVRGDRSRVREVDVLPLHVQHPGRYAGAQYRLGQLQSDNPSGRRLSRPRNAAGAAGHPHSGRIAGHGLSGIGPCHSRNHHRHLDERRGAGPAQGSSGEGRLGFAHHHGHGRRNPFDPGRNRARHCGKRLRAL